MDILSFLFICKYYYSWVLTIWKENVEQQIRQRLLEQTSDLAFRRQLLSKVTFLNKHTRTDVRFSLQKAVAIKGNISQ